MARGAAKLKQVGAPASGPNLGECLRALRQKHNWSLATVREKTGLATSTLSRIENNRLSLTYDATAEGVKPDDVIDELMRQVAVAV